MASKMRRLALLPLALGCAPPDYITAHGLEVYNAAYSAVEVEAVTNAVLDLIGGTGSTLDGLQLYFLVEVGTWQEGLTYYGDRFEVEAHHECLARGVLAHELLHHFQWVQDDYQDHHHSDPKWWAKTGRAESLEAQANHEAIGTLCPRKEP